MKQPRLFILFVLVALLLTSIHPTRTALASNSAQGSVTASAVALPVQVTELGFVIPALVKEITVKEGDQVQAGQTLVTLDTPELQFVVAAAEAALRSAEANAKVQSYRRVKDRRNGRVFFDVVPPEVRQVADAKVQQAQAALEVAQASLAQNTLIAPHDGTIASINVVQGEFVQLDQIVLTLAMLDNLQIETTDLSERDITKVHIGNSANVFIEALNENVNGEVIGISPIADTVGGDVVFRVTIELDEQPKGLLWGMTAEVTIGE
ncbi:MAG: efflux RND transporter periplasmic adaptor subunit [Anaerolineae bacterium]|nr:efflux RND transporter periplasmic adaptor subunit [Anaerolineae bacterium]MCI0610365.1 efflux RND transporter periplasmic adaptor subunit [Anaerolineae bacterium]